MSNLSKILVLGSNSFTAGYLIQHVLQSQKDCSVVAISRSPQVNPVMSAYLSSGNDRGRVEFRQLSVNHQASEIVSVCDKFKPEYIFNFVNCFLPKTPPGNILFTANFKASPGFFSKSFSGVVSLIPPGYPVCL